MFNLEEIRHLENRKNQLNRLVGVAKRAPVLGLQKSAGLLLSDRAQVLGYNWAISVLDQETLELWARARECREA